MPEESVNVDDFSVTARRAFEKALFAVLANTDKFHAVDEAGRDLFASWDGQNWVISVPNTDPEAEAAVIKLSVKVELA